MRICGITILFEGPKVHAFPLTEQGGSSELEEALPAFCKLLLAHPDLIACLAGLHDRNDHAPGTCVRR